VVGQHRQRVASIDRLIQTVTGKVIGHGAAFKNAQKTVVIEYLFESSDHPYSPHQHSWELQGQCVSRIEATTARMQPQGLRDHLQGIAAKVRTVQ
jgi:hypothetical protein